MTDYRRVIELILEELARAGAVAPSRCACHGFTSECCPDRVQHVLDAGATRLGLHAADGGASGVSGYIDHTLLKPDATASEIEQLCREAAEWKFATVCINPTWVALAARQLRGTPVGVCTVVGFPLGATTPDVKQFEARRAIFDGAIRDRHGDQRRRPEVRRRAPGHRRHSRRRVGLSRRRAPAAR